MESYEVRRKLLSLGPSYEVTRPGEEALLLTVKGTLTSMKLTLRAGADGPELAQLDPNWLGTTYEMKAPNDEKVATLTFPVLAFKQSFELVLGSRTLKADGGFLATSFRCVEADGQVAFTVSWQVGWTDQFLVEVQDGFPRDVAVLATIAIQKKFYENA